MQFEGTRRSGQAPNLTPLIDIVFLLLVFFMLTAHFINDEGLPIELPEAVSATALDEKEPLEVVIERSGALRIDGKVISYEMLAGQLADVLAGRSDKRVVIRGDSGVTLGDSVRVIDAARQAGATGVDIVTEKPKG
ncbi:outer membrane transport energization protein ExbD [Mariprofundus ferrinatatus]|uniref:Outer membrane transport energization protein ExbD n=1 Tax=Mariprofundus ferrinatatus TaxID=1921087 RepID=A0A2K8L500_9PROT|nr:biopolymer transporter ExbD [Mariprofundus ferrinatatus]ATX82357.1 outer membrane transport energization protein ExbD [Mariprofundus ferrinatatus]